MHAIHNGSEDESKKTKKNQTITISKALFTNGLRFNDVIKKVEIIDTSR